MRGYRTAMTALLGILLLAAAVMLVSLYHIADSRLEVQRAIAAWNDSDDAERYRGDEEVPLPDSLVSDSGAAGLSPSGGGTANVDSTPPAATPAVRGGVVGILRIPKLNAEFPIWEGTGTKELAKGVGHYATSALPGEVGNAILAGHRDSVFRRLGELKEGDLLILTAKGKTFTYRMTGHRIVDADDRSVTTGGDRPLLTLVTCYPFRYVGNAPDRYLLAAELVEKGSPA